MLRANPDGCEREIYASGLRNTIGFDWHPKTGKLFGMDHGIDWLGNNEQREELNEIIRGGKYGWPYVYADGKYQDYPEKMTMADVQSLDPVLLYTAHSAPMQMTFYTADQFPAEYRNDAFVAMRGSWNRKPPSGYEVVRIEFSDDGKPLKIEPFLTGFLVAQGKKHAQFGRPAGVVVMNDGSLIVGDDTSNVLYRISYAPGAAGRTAPKVADGQIASSALHAPSTIKVTSEAIEQQAPIPIEFTGYGNGISPPLSWSNVPENAESLVLMLESPDAQQPRPFVHWLIANIPPTMTALPENVPDKESVIEGALQGSTSTSSTGYYGPRPPAGEPPHQYHFQIFALDTELELPSGYNRETLLQAMEGRVIAKGELVGTYQHAKTASAQDAFLLQILRALLR